MANHSSVTLLQTDAIITTGWTAPFQDIPGRHEHPSRLLRSLDQDGILQPLLVIAGDGDPVLVDGFARHAWAKQRGEEQVPCHILAASTPPAALLRLLLNAHGPVFMATAMSRCLFAGIAVDSGMVPSDEFIRDFLPDLDLESHPRILQRCRNITAMPGALRQFCHEKKFSLKQCYQLARQTDDTALRLLNPDFALHLTAALLDELSTGISEILRRDHCTFAEFLQRTEAGKILEDGQLSSQERTKALRRVVRARRFPILTNGNRRLQDLRRQLNLPRQVSLSWDPVLERPDLELRARIQGGDQWQGIVSSLNQPGAAGIVSAMLEEL